MIAVLDACVLYPAVLRDLWMHLTLEQVFAARWTKEIHLEWTRNALKNHPASTAAQWHRVSNLMDSYAKDAIVTSYEPIIEKLVLPDAKDRHVLAAAIQCQAVYIVTFNLKDFPASALKPHGIQAIHPDQFLSGLISGQLEAVLTAIRFQRSQLKKPVLEAQELLNKLAVHTPKSAVLLSEFASRL